MNTTKREGVLAITMDKNTIKIDIWTWGNADKTVEAIVRDLREFEDFDRQLDIRTFEFPWGKEYGDMLYTMALDEVAKRRPQVIILPDDYFGAANPSGSQLAKKIRKAHKNVVVHESGDNLQAALDRIQVNA